MLGWRAVSWKSSLVGTRPWGAAFRGYSTDLMPEEDIGGEASGSAIRDTPEKPVQEMPGPRIYPIIGSTYKYAFGDYSLERMGETGIKKFEEYGPIVREKLGGIDMINVFKPEDIKALFRFEFKWPTRYSHTAVEKYRLGKPELYCSPGILAANGPTWKNLRLILQEPLAGGTGFRMFIPVTDKIIDKFQALASKRMAYPPEDFVTHLFDMYQELVGVVSFDVELNCMDESSQWEGSVTNSLRKAARTITEVVPQLDISVKLWKTFETPLYRKFKKAHQVLESVAVRYVDEKFNEINRPGRDPLKNKAKSLLESYLTDSRLSRKDVYGTTVDYLMAGVDVLSYSTSFQLYYLATNPEKQHKLAEEALKLLPKKDTEITPEILEDAKYTRAVIKESFRMVPNAFGTGRMVTSKEGYVLSGYRVLGGMNVLTQMQASCRNAQYFKNPDTFIPERWLRETGERLPQEHVWLMLPFSQGLRACIARRFAEQTMQMVLLRTMRCFRVTWEGGKLGCVGSPNRPDKPLLLRFHRRAP